MLGVSVHSFTQLGGRAAFMCVHLDWCDFAMDPTKEQHEFSCKSRKECERRPWQWLETLSGKKAWSVRGDRTHWDPRRWERWSAKSRVCSSFPLTSRGLFTKNSSWQAKQSNPHVTVTFYGDCVNMCEDFVPNFSAKKNGYCITTTHRCITLCFSPGSFLTEATWLSSPTHPAFLCFSRLKIKLKGRHFGTIDVIDAESQAVLNTLTEHEFRMH
jgi:hypothetical protein